MAEVVASMTVTISTDWSNWMKGLDGSEQWRTLLHEFCNKRCIKVVHNGNIIHLSGNFEAIKDVRGLLQDAATHASEKREKEEKERIKIYERKTSISPTTGLEEKCEQMKIAGPEGTEKREDAKPKRVRILKVTAGAELTEGEKPDGVTRSDDVGNGTCYHHDSSTNLTKMPVNQNQSTESQMLDDKLISSDEMMTTKIEKPRNGFDSQLNDEMTPDILKRQMPQIHKIAYQGQMQESIYPPLSPDKFSANAGQMVQPIYTPLDQAQTEQCSYPSHGQGQATGHQGQLRQQSYPSQGQGQVAGHQTQTNHLGNSSQGHGQATGLQGQTAQQSYPSQEQGHATGLQGQTAQPSYPSHGQGQATGLQGQTVQHSYPSHGHGQHQVQVQQPSHSSQCHVTNYQGVSQPYVNAVNPGHGLIFHPRSPLPPMHKQFLIRYADHDTLHFTSNRAYNVLNIIVHKGNIVDQRTQVLVSSANCHLTTHGSVSQAILKAAGQSVVDECSQIIATWGFLAFGAVISTKAGNLGPHVEDIIHAIIPTTQEFQKDPQQAFNLLIYVFQNTLCMSSGHTKSVSFPAIGSEIFGLQRMAEAFICGLRAFDQGASSWPAIFIPGEIHLISNDLNKLKTIVQALYHIVNIV